MPLDSAPRCGGKQATPSGTDLGLWPAPLDPELPQHERVVEGELVQFVVSAGRTAVAGAEIGLEQQKIGVGLTR